MEPEGFEPPPPTRRNHALWALSRLSYGPVRLNLRAENTLDCFPLTQCTYCVIYKVNDVLPAAFYGVERLRLFHGPRHALEFKD